MCGWRNWAAAFGSRRKRAPDLRILQHGRARHLHRHLALQHRVVGPVHGPKGPRPQARADLEAAELLGNRFRSALGRPLGGGGRVGHNNRLSHRRAERESQPALLAHRGAANLDRIHLVPLAALRVGTLCSNEHGRSRRLSGKPSRTYAKQTSRASGPFLLPQCNQPKHSVKGGKLLHQ
jgi:hypothetical protein